MHRPLYRHSDLARVLDPKSIAVVGASRRPEAMGHRALKNLENFRGTVYAINSRQGMVIDGINCYPSLTALPEIPDCVILATPRERILELVEECGRVGVGGIIIFASGFAEEGSDEQIAEQARIAAAAKSANVRLIGPNCMGMVNFDKRAACTFVDTFGLGFDRKTDVPSIGVVSQSGALGFALMQAVAHGTSFSHLLTSGNSADVDAADLVAYLAEHDDCRVIACVFEGLSEPLRLIEAAQIARANGKHVIVHKIATGEQGAAAALSHTGTLAGGNAIYMAAFRKAGIVPVDNFEALLETAAFLAKAGPCGSNGAAVMATSGGAAIMAADKADAAGVTLLQPSQETAAIVASIIPIFGAARNPYDITAQVVSDLELYGKCAKAVLADPAFGVLVVPFLSSSAVMLDRLKVLSELAQKSNKPVCVVWLTQWLEGPGTTESETWKGLSIFRSMDNCFQAIARWHEVDDKSKPSRPDFKLVVPEPAQARVKSALKACASQIVNESAAKEILRQYDIPMVADRLTSSVDDCLAAASALGYPVAMKIDSAAIPHKTDAGVVRLNVASAEAVRVAYADLMTNALKVASADQLNGVLVQPMVHEGLEIIVGARVDPFFGPLVVVGLGGILVELLKDSVIELAPLGKADALDLLRRLKGYPLLRGIRGRPPVDIDELARIICLVGEFVVQHRDSIIELDINPLICGEKDIVAVDALIVRREPTDSTH